MISRLVDVLKGINDTVYHSNLAVNSLNYDRSFLLTLADVYVSTIYDYIDSPGKIIVTPTLNDPVDLRTILNNIQKVIPK